MFIPKDIVKSFVVTNDQLANLLRKAHIYKAWNLGLANPFLRGIVDCVIDCIAFDMILSK